MSCRSPPILRRCSRKGDAVDQDLKLELWQFRQDVVSASQDIAAKIRPILPEGIAEPAAIYYHPDGSSGLLALAEALAILTTPVIEQLCALGVQVDQLTNLIANPEATRADELYRRAVKAFSFEWLEESANDARLALDADPYHFGAYYLLGRIAIRGQQPAAAGTSFAKAARYAAPSQPKLAATAALAGMHCYRGPGGIPRRQPDSAPAPWQP